MNLYIEQFENVNISGIRTVGGKNMSLDRMIARLTARGVRVSDGFTITAFAFESFLSYNSLHLPLHNLMLELDRKDFSNLKEIGAKARALLLATSSVPPVLRTEILNSYKNLCSEQPQEVIVTSSSTEDLPRASFAGQHEPYFNIKGNDALIAAIKGCFASLYTDRAIKYREDNGFAHEKITLSVGIKKMVR